jgi:hypothetical protein
LIPAELRAWTFLVIRLNLASIRVSRFLSRRQFG